MTRLVLPIILLALSLGFWASSNFQQIAAGVAIFLFGMRMLEDGFKLFSGGFLERMLEKATSSVPRALGFGIVTTTIMQSSSLVSIITISFLSAGLISLIGGVGIIFGANLGTTTGAWLVAGLGMKVDISAYAMPMLGLAIVLVFQKNKYLRGAGYVLAGLGFLFLGIHHMKEGFDAFKEQFDLSKFALGGLVGLVVYTLIGAVATVVMQSSHATMTLIITALAASQITYDNALALAIGANIGTTITAILGALTANYQGRRLALAHLIFNSATAAVALAFITPIRHAVDWVSGHVGIAADDFTLKLAVFHTIFNLLGVVLMLPLMHRLIGLLERGIPEPEDDLSKPKYLSAAVDAFPPTAYLAMSREVAHLYENASEVIAHGLNLHRHQLFTSNDVGGTVEASRTPMDFDLDEQYERRIKTLYAAIVEFSTRIGAKDLPEPVTERIYNLRDVAERIVRSVKAVKHLRNNTSRYTSHDQGQITLLYDQLRIGIARILVEIRKLEEADPDTRTSLWLDQELVQVEQDSKATNSLIARMIRENRINARMATSFLNDSHYAYTAMNDLLAAARSLYIESEDAMAEVERILAIDKDDLDGQDNI